MRVINNISEMKAFSRESRSLGKTIGFVPTMGYLHQGHLSLVRAARQQCDTVVMSIFVNPAQFGANEDLDTYPRDLQRDCQLAQTQGVDVIFAPAEKEIYPAGYSTYVEMSGLTQKLCGLSRPDFFRGVCTVVCKLFNIVAPDKAFFGQKDAQQYLVVKKMAAELNMDVEIIAMPIIRESDGLAMSSRNKYLSVSERQEALVLATALKEAEGLIFYQGIRETAVIKNMIRQLVAEKQSAKLEYAEILSLPDLENTINLAAGQYMIALCVWIGQTRLIDNVIITI